MKKFILCVITCSLIGFANNGYAEELLAPPPIATEQVEEIHALCEPPVCEPEILAAPPIAEDQEEVITGLIEPPVPEVIEEQKKNAERIREMTDEELAEFIVEISNGTWNKKDALDWLGKQVE